MTDNTQAKLLKITSVVEYADGTKSTLTVDNPAMDVSFREESYDDAIQIEVATGTPPTRIAGRSYMLRRFALVFVADEATTIVVQTDTPRDEEPGNG